jgi:hypothetical protein
LINGLFIFHQHPDQCKLMIDAGGVLEYMRGCAWRGGDTALTATGGMCYNDAEGHQPPPAAA